MVGYCTTNQSCFQKLPNRRIKPRGVASQVVGTEVAPTVLALGIPRLPRPSSILGYVERQRKIGKITIFNGKNMENHHFQWEK